MIKGMVGRKLGMTQIFDESGLVHPVTVIECGPNVVTQIRTTEKDGYEAVQVGYGVDKRLNKPERGHLKPSGYENLRELREVKADNVGDFEVGQVITADAFSVGELVDVTGTSKGRGFQGGVKRHGFRGGPKTHGQSDRHRAPGSIGASATPGRVLKGMRMAGHMGHDRVTVQNLKVLRVDAERNLLLIEGSVPGHNKALVLIRRAVKGQPNKK
ncbi:MAG: large subunit ribosomal protein [Thermomicrobiales bacterium]|jgi:large subunit ribosomal protein L3|nr:large subunit ribosomal protein [Thermomicrobiales bacterium]MEA2586844.1 large subunit ribosomal protein [Thermomicrobiales bacterium]MEA2595658.1 large subunit ribosomal protein [Thermomicrobiales bacterium]